jgi:threonine synthase
LTSANSINFGRILPQSIYYVYAYAQLAAPGEEIVFSVPSGNFGNALGCEYARRMGLPVAKLLMPTNENDEFPNYLRTGKYTKVAPSRDCISNAMNVGHPSNLARFFELYGGTVDRSGVVHRYPDIAEMRQHIFSVSIADEETRQTIKNIYELYKTVLEQHGAVGWAGLTAYRKMTADKNLAVSLETAHPASMKDIDQRQGDAVTMSSNYENFKNYLQINLKIKE